MSRIHEAVRKSIWEQQPGAAPAMSSVESILSASYTLKAAASPEPLGPVPAGCPADDSELLRSISVSEWLPDKKRMLFFAEAADTPGREQFRSLRIRLIQLQEKRPLTAFSVASSLSGEGKSFVAANLAHALSLQGDHRALLIDSDLRRGSIAAFLGARPAPGLAEYLQGHLPLESVIQRGMGGNLYLIPSGVRTADPGELIGSLQMRELFSRLRPLFDWIVVDTPPAVQFADAGMITGLCDGALMVVGSGQTPAQLAKRTVRALREDRIVGIILNRAEDLDHSSKYFSYYKAPGD